VTARFARRHSGVASGVRPKENELGIAAIVPRPKPVLVHSTAFTLLAHSFLIVWLEQPDIILGNRDLSYNVAAYGNVTGRGPDSQREKIMTTQVFGVRRDGHTARLPIMTGLSFPGPGRSAVCLVRPYGKISQVLCTFPADKERPDEEPLPTTLVIGFSDVDGLDAAVDTVAKLVRKAGR